MIVRKTVARVALAAGLLTAFGCEPIPLVPEPEEPSATPAAPTLNVDKGYLTGRDHPWDIAFLPDATMVFTEKYGTINLRLSNGTIRTIGFVDDAYELMGLTVDPKFASGQRYIYTCAATDGDANDVNVTRWTLGKRLGIIARRDIVSIEWHGPYSIKNGCRLGFRPGTEELYVTTGDAHNGTYPQRLDVLAGKVLRVDRDGAPWPGNPFGDEVYSYGFRNPQGLAFKDGDVYITEHGPDAEDEVTRLDAGGNGGWDPGDPYPDEFGAGVPMTDLTKFPDAMVPMYTTGTEQGTIAPSGATFLTGTSWQGWEGRLAMATLKGSHLRVLSAAWDDYDVALAEGVRLRTAVQGPDGALYVATDVPAPGGAIWRVEPVAVAEGE